MGKIYGENLVSNSKHWPLMTIQGPLAVVGLATQSPPEGTGGSLVTLLVLNWCKIPSDGILIASGTGTMYLKPLVKQKWCKFRGLCLHSTSVLILSNINVSFTFYTTLQMIFSYKHLWVCELGKKGLKCPRRPSWPSRRPRPSSRPFFTTDDLFWCLRHVLDVHGSLHGLFWQPTDFFDNRWPF